MIVIHFYIKKLNTGIYGFNCQNVLNKKKGEDK